MRTEPPTTAMARAKRPKTALAGPYGHPLHPLVVTVPIGAWVSSLVLDVGSQYAGDPGDLARASFWLIAIGVITALLAALLGLMDLLAIPRGTRAFRTGLAHMALNLLIVGMYGANLWWRIAEFDEAVDPGPLILNAAAVALLLVSGWLGGHMAYRYGVRVADEGVQSDAYV